jgi:flagellar biosynthesis chaperone FliJ
MAAFRFRLERVLDWYGKELRVEQGRLGLCLSALRTVQDSLLRLDAERTAVERELIAQLSIPGCEFAALGLYRLRVRKHELELVEDRGRREQAVREQTGKVQQAQRKVRLLEKLRERRVAEHLYAEDRELENLAADAYLARWATRRPPADDKRP